MAPTDEWPQFRKDIHYSNESKLNTLQTCIPRPTSANDRRRLWVLYIHGGAWRDPLQTSSCFDKAQSILLQSSIEAHIAGYASINYRLSPSPAHSTHPSSPTDPARNARHPDHINDVLTAILHLQETYCFGERYVLVGHSCGATLACQVAMSREWSAQNSAASTVQSKVVPPIAILGIEGIYDLPALVRYHPDQAIYRTFTESAFGTRQEDWHAVSPVNSTLAQSWPHGKLLVIAHSHEDELVEWEQVELILASLASQGFAESGPRTGKLLTLKGQHEQVWREGTEVARAIEFAVGQVVSLL